MEDQNKSVGKFNETVRKSRESIGQAVTLTIGDGEVQVEGLTPKPFLPPQALVLIRQDSKFYIKGAFDGKEYGTSQIDAFDHNKITVSIDLKDKENIQIYYRTGETTAKLQSKKIKDPNDFFLAFWENESRIYLVSSTFDPETKKLRKDNTSAVDQKTKQFIKSFVRISLSNSQSHDFEENHSVTVNYLGINEKSEEESYDELYER
ncbi:hypothetical protein [Saccharibacillus sacchari]|uniref:hypothetical protein n=1 Tax=Saccharibacillus sacchari TaxID=456493 RepID=UPI00056D164E|nr:hypothetical protein [Saccharibacillus sacchari]